MKKGKFFVFEGIDGCGKATQAKLLAEFFKKEGYKVEEIDFPQHGKRSAMMADDYMNGIYGTLNEVGPYAASIFFACDRFDASFKIRKWLNEGKIVISDRYLVSNLGHQGSKMVKNKKEWKKYVNWLYDLEYNIFKIPKPDYIFILKTSAEFSSKLSNNIVDELKRKKIEAYLGSNKQDIYERDIEHQKDALSSFVMVAKEFPNDCKVIECLDKGLLLAPEIINQKIIKVIEQKFL